LKLKNYIAVGWKATFNICKVLQHKIKERKIVFTHFLFAKTVGADFSNQVTQMIFAIARKNHANVCNYQCCNWHTKCACIYMGIIVSGNGCLE